MPEDKDLTIGMVKRPETVKIKRGDGTLEIMDKGEALRRERQRLRGASGTGKAPDQK